MRTAYEAWSKENGTRPLSSQKFNRAAQSMGLVATRTSAERRWKLEDPHLFPGESGNNDMTGVTEINPNSQSSTTQPPIEEEKENFAATGSKPVIPVSQDTNWKGEEEL